MKRWSVQREPYGWAVRNPDGVLVAHAADWQWAVDLADRAARQPDLGGYV